MYNQQSMKSECWLVHEYSLAWQTSEERKETVSDHCKLTYQLFIQISPTVTVTVARFFSRFFTLLLCFSLLC